MHATWGSIPNYRISIFLVSAEYGDGEEKVVQEGLMNTHFHTYVCVCGCTAARSVCVLVYSGQKCVCACVQRPEMGRELSMLDLIFQATNTRSLKLTTVGNGPKAHRVGPIVIVVTLLYPPQISMYFSRHFKVQPGISRQMWL